MTKEPSHKREDRIRWVVWKIGWTLVRIFLVPFLRIRIERKIKFPRSGPLLVVSNHPCPWDVMMVPMAMLRQTHILGTDQLLRVPYFGWTMPYFSMIPFKKGMKDPAALAELERRVRMGDACLIFAEGDRTWTGRSNPIKPGIGRMIKRLDVPVACVRVANGHMQWPRWAKHPRTMPLIIEHVALQHYPSEATPEEITADISRHISVDPYEVEVPARAWGWKLARGLPNFMWACPACFHHDALTLVEDDHNCVRCHGCGARWRVDLGCWMRDEGGISRDMHIEEAYERIKAHFGALPVLDDERHAAAGVALEGEVALERVHPGQVEAELLGLGHLELLDQGLRFVAHEGHERVELSFEPVVAVLMQVGNRLQIRTSEDNYQISPTVHSINMWKYFLDRHLRTYREAKKAAAESAGS